MFLFIPVCMRFAYQDKETGSLSQRQGSSWTKGVSPYKVQVNWSDLPIKLRKGEIAISSDNSLASIAWLDIIKCIAFVRTYQLAGDLLSICL